MLLLLLLLTPSPGKGLPDQETQPGIRAEACFLQEGQRRDGPNLGCRTGHLHFLQA